jgi:hypothetical protein
VPAQRPAAEAEPGGEGAEGGGEHQRRRREVSSRQAQSIAGATATRRSRGIMRAE